MKVKDSYSLRVDEIIGEVPTAENFPLKADEEINLELVQQDCEESFNIFEAFANYLVERTRTQDLRQQISTAEEALDTRNAEARRQSEIIIANYSERVKKFLATKRQELELETQRIELENFALVEGIRDAREHQKSQLNALMKVLAFYRSALEQIQNFLTETENSPELFVTRIKFYHQAKEDCRIKMKRINDLLKRIV